MKMQMVEVVKKGERISSSGWNLNAKLKGLLVNCVWGVREREARMVPVFLF